MLPNRFPRLSPSFITLLLLASLHASVVHAESAPPAQSAGAPASASSASAQPSAQAPAKRSVAIGMTMEEVRKTVGAPSATRDIRTGEASGVVWIYNFGAKDEHDMVVTGMHEVPYVHPITGEMKNLMEPTYSLQKSKSRQVIELLFVEGKLVSSKRFVEKVNDFQ